MRYLTLAMAFGLASIPAAAPLAAEKAAEAAKATADLKLDDFETAQASNGNTWWSGCDSDNLGTTIRPTEYAPEKGGCKASPGQCAHIKGKLGVNNGEKYPWAVLSLDLVDKNITGYSGVSFWVKGDGKEHAVRLEKDAVTDYAHYTFAFTASKEWTKVTVKFTEFQQPADWGNKVPQVFNDVSRITFVPKAEGQEYEFFIDEVTLTK